MWCRAQYDISFIPAHYWDFSCVFCSVVSLHHQVQGSSDTVSPKQRLKGGRQAENIGGRGNKKKGEKKKREIPSCFCKHLPQPPGCCGDHMFHTWPYFGLGLISSEEFSSLKFEIKHRPGFAALPELLPPPTVFLGAVNRSFFFLNLLLGLGVSRSWVCSFSLVSLWASALGGHNQPLFLPLSSERNPNCWQSLSACWMLDVYQPLITVFPLKYFAMCPV